jgi:hypothetical protein
VNFKDVPPGRYLAHITDYGVESIEKLGGLPKAVITFEIQIALGESTSGRWEGFFETKDGKPNQNTCKTLVTCGFGSDDPLDLNKGDSLDNATEYQVTIEKDGEYNKIKWVNKPGVGASIKKSTTAKRVGSGVKKALQDARKELGITPAKKVKNYAPGAQADDELPF